MSWRQPERVYFEIGLKWRGSEHIGGRMLKMELPRTKKRGISRTRSVDVVKVDMYLVGVTEEDEDGVRWTQVM